MNKDKVQNQNILGTLVNKDESGIIAYSDQIYDKKADKSLEEENVKQNERLDNVEAKDRELQSTLEGITKTGEASAASNVTYNHNDSKLDATNVQQAIDEVRKKSNYNDGDNVIDFNAIHIITDNPEFICVAVDTNNKILYGVKADGQPYFGVGCPQQVKDYIDEQINKILGTDDITTTIDSLKEIEAFLKDFTNSDTLKTLLDTKANKTDVDNAIANINADIADKYKKSNPNDEEGNVIDTNSIKSVINNPEYFKAFVDNTNKLIEAIGLDGVRKFFAGINIQGTLQCVTDKSDYIVAWVDKENKIIFAIQHDGNPYFGYGVPKQIKTVIDKINADLVNKYKEIKQSISETSADIDKKINLGNNVYPSGVHEVSDVEDYKSLLLDNLNHILESVGSDGVRKFFAGIEVAGNKFTTTNNPEYKAVLLDKDNKIIFAIQHDGQPYWGVGVPKVVKDYVETQIGDVDVHYNDTVYDELEILNERMSSHVTGTSVEQKQSLSNQFRNIELRNTFFRDNGNIWVDDNFNRVVVNPITDYDAADPSYIKVGDYFYMFHTGKPCLIDRSKDLVNWEKGFSQVFADDFNYNQLPNFSNAWANDINVIDGRYVDYIAIWTGDTETSYVIAMYADSINGPWSYGGIVCPSYTNGGPVKQPIDPEYVYDGNDGYLIVGSFKGIYMAKTSADGLSITGSWTKIASDGGGEGSYIFKYKGYYYLFSSLGDYNKYTYCIGISRSQTLDANFVNKAGENMLQAHPNRIMYSDENDILYGPGHNGEIYTDDDNNMYIIFHCHVKDLTPKNSNRFAMIMRIVEDPDGWLAFADKNGNIVSKPTFECSVPKIGD